MTFRIEQANIQEKIEEIITNGLGYERIQQERYHKEDDCDLQIHLGLMDHIKYGRECKDKDYYLLDLEKLKKEIIKLNLKDGAYGTFDQINRLIYLRREAKRDRELKASGQYVDTFVGY